MKLTVRSLSIAVMAFWVPLGIADAALGETPAPNEFDMIASSRADTSVAERSVAAYRQYVKLQADTLVGMTRLLKSEIAAGNVQAAQSAYAPAHRYLKRIEPLVKTLHDLDRRMDSRAAAYEAKESDPRFSGFHRLEYGLFVTRSTAGLSDHADRLYRDSLELRERIKIIEIEPNALVDAAADLVKNILDKKLDGDEERYSHTDLWDFEANIDGVQNIVVTLQPVFQTRNPVLSAQTAGSFAKINALLEKHKDGCGYKNYDELSEDDKTALKSPVIVLAAALTPRRAALAND